MQRNATWPVLHIALLTPLHLAQSRGFVCFSPIQHSKLPNVMAAMTTTSTHAPSRYHIFESKQQFLCPSGTIRSPPTCCFSGTMVHIQGRNLCWGLTPSTISGFPTKLDPTGLGTTDKTRHSRISARFHSGGDVDFKYTVANHRLELCRSQHGVTYH